MRWIDDMFLLQFYSTQLFVLRLPWQDYRVSTLLFGFSFPENNQTRLSLSFEQGCIYYHHPHRTV